MTQCVECCSHTDLAGESASWQGNNNEPDDTERSQRADEAL